MSQPQPQQPAPPQDKVVIIKSKGKVKKYINGKPVK